MSNNHDTLVEATGASDSRLQDALRVLLADVVTFSHMLQGAHWNVVGRNFHQDHAFFSMLYEDVDGSIDTIAELLRRLGALSPHGLTEFQQLRSVDDGPTSTDGDELLRVALEINTSILASWDFAFNLADLADEQGIANFAAERMDLHQKWAWQIRAHLGMK